MDGFALMAESCRRAVERGQMTEGWAAKRIRIYEFLAACDQEDYYLLFDSTAFNEIAKDYMRAAVRELIEEEIIDEDQGRAMRNRYALLFDEKTAKEVSQE